MEHSNQNTGPALSKKPFWIADAVFVLFAFIIAYASEGGMTAGNAIWVVFCVIAGAILLVAPYYLEFSVRSKLHRFEHDQASWDKVSQLNDAISALEASRIKLAETPKGNAGPDNEILKALIEDIKKLIQGHIQSDINTLKTESKATASIINKWDELENAPIMASQDASTDETVQELVREQKEQMQRLMEKIEPVLAAHESEPKSLVALVEQFDEIQQSLLNIHSQIDSVVAQTDIRDATGLAEIDNEEREPGHLMSRAFGNKDQDTSAVQKIISASKAAEAPKADIAGDDAPESEPEKMTDEPGAIDLEAPTEAQDVKPEASIEKEQTFVLPEAELDSPTPSKLKKGDTCLIVHALIGIGNKPYVRGKGAGLSEDEGRPMEFVEIGKWQLSLGKAEENVECQVYLNDETAAEGDPIAIDAGATVAVSPRFPN